MHHIPRVCAGNVVNEKCLALLATWHLGEHDLTTSKPADDKPD